MITLVISEIHLLQLFPDLTALSAMALELFHAVVVVVLECLPLPSMVKLLAESSEKISMLFVNRKVSMLKPLLTMLFLKISTSTIQVCLSAQTMQFSSLTIWQVT